jgi:hypothetical protein
LISITQLEKTILIRVKNHRVYIYTFNKVYTQRSRCFKAILLLIKCVHSVSLLTDESGCEADMSEGADVGRHSPPRPQQEPINLKNEVSYSTLTLFYVYTYFVSTLLCA